MKLFYKIDLSNYKKLNGTKNIIMIFIINILKYLVIVYGSFKIISVYAVGNSNERLYNTFIMLSYIGFLIYQLNHKFSFGNKSNLLNNPELENSKLNENANFEDFRKYYINKLTYYLNNTGKYTKGIDDYFKWTWKFIKRSLEAGEVSKTKFKNAIYTTPNYEELTKELEEKLPNDINENYKLSNITKNIINKLENALNNNTAKAADVVNAAQPEAASQLFGIDQPSSSPSNTIF